MNWEHNAAHVTVCVCIKKGSSRLSELDNTVVGVRLGARRGCM